METPLSREELIEKIKSKENVSKVDTSEIKDMSDLFYGKDATFNQPLNEWDVSSVRKMPRMFFMSLKFNQPLNDWDVSNVKDMRDMFCGAVTFNQPLNDWDVSNVKDMVSMFAGAKRFNQPLNDWDVSNVKDMRCMFNGASRYIYSFKTWKLNSRCKTDHFLLDCHLWHLVNTVEDLPMQDGKRIKLEGDKTVWKIL